jgi:hypothetical protein
MLKTFPKTPEYQLNIINSCINVGVQKQVVAYRVFYGILIQYNIAMGAWGLRRANLKYPKGFVNDCR